MASRVSFTQVRLEAELERYRAESQWDKMPLVVEQMQAARIHEDGEFLAGLGKPTSLLTVRVCVCVYIVFPTEISGFR